MISTSSGIVKSLNGNTGSHPAATVKREAQIRVESAEPRDSHFGKGFWSLANQGVVSLGNFFTNICMAYMLPPAEYGAFALLNGVLLFLNGIHGALVIYPLSVKGAQVSRQKLNEITSVSLIFTAALAIPLAGVILIAAGSLERLILVPTIFAAAVLWQLQETLRRTLMSHTRHREAMLGDALSYLGQALIIVVLANYGLLSIGAAFGAMAITSGVACLVTMWQLKSRLSDWREAQVKEWGRSFWQLGKWSLWAALLSVFTLYIYPWTLAAVYGAEAVASLQAVINVLGVTNPVVFGIGNLIVPAVSRAAINKDIVHARQIAARYAAQGALLLIPYWLIILLYPGAILKLFYGAQSPYIVHADALRLTVAVYVLMYITQILSGLLNGLEQSRLFFLSLVVSALVAVGIGIPLAAWGGIEWALIGMTFVAVSRVIANLLFVRQTSRFFGGTDGVVRPS